MKNNMRYLLPIALSADLIIPFLLAPFYKGYSHTMQVMSVLGNNKSPMHTLYNIWLVILGIVILSSNFLIYSIISNHSKVIAVGLVCIITIYAIGACILSGFFPVGETKSLAGLSEKIHGYGSVIGFMLLILAPVLISIYFYKSNQILFSVISLICFVLAVLFFSLFVMADKPKYLNTIIAFEGLWQRLTLLFMYIPIAFVCLSAEVK